MYAAVPSRILLISFSVLAFAACDAKHAPGSGESNAAPLAFQDDYVKYNGQRLDFTQDLSNWINVLGPNHRTAFPDDPGIVVWDDLGIRVYTNHPRNQRVVTASVTLRGEPEDSLSYIPPGEGVRPRQDYAYSVLVNGVRVNKGTRVGDIAHLSAGQLRIDCSRGISICGASRNDEKFIQMKMYFGVDDRRYDSTPYVIEFGPGSNPAH
ncbi:TPA: hypothetical protein QDZ99_002985 [Stenotrophomonas maltophilia]|nr:hypothetical protein [Stenotrophomonas maltophilia]HDS1157228.1 hypothetical protein [Stenotrophomonas maltophilia]HDS1167659.1 hypothetical protein [Stenotrophomonas maltophilia]HDS1171259.1 hypothetical protein [Stenotrophomonas maltophilia]HDS1175043.1 hypothetical protein [Stenotrophomonas maltophilia]